MTSTTQADVADMAELIDAARQVWIKAVSDYGGESILGEGEERAAQVIADYVIGTHAALSARLAEVEAENERLRGIVRGWHYLAVGPDEMGDYYTHKQLIKASEPYASPALAALEGKAEQ